MTYGNEYMLSILAVYMQIVAYRQFLQAVSRPVPGRPRCTRHRVDSEGLQAWAVNIEVQFVDLLIGRTAAKSVQRIQRTSG